LLDELRALILRFFQRETFELVGGRVYAAELAEVYSPSFPCINFRLGGGLSEISGLVSDIPLLIWVWSSKSFDEAHKVYDLLRIAMQREHLVGSSVIVVLTELALPTEAYDPVGGLYYLAGRFSAKAIRK